jgi:hypothetical protein
VSSLFSHQFPKFGVPVILPTVAQSTTQFTIDTLGLIDSFLTKGEHKIVIDELTTDSPLDNIDDENEMEEEFLSEELAEIYAKQHLFDLAIEIYQKLSLQDSQKSVYFAELIEGLKKQRLEEDNKK